MLYRDIVFDAQEYLDAFVPKWDSDLMSASRGWSSLALDGIIFHFFKEVKSRVFSLKVAPRSIEDAFGKLEISVLSRLDWLIIHQSIQPLSLANYNIQVPFLFQLILRHNLYTIQLVHINGSPVHTSLSLIRKSN